MFDGKHVSGLIGNELVEVAKTIEEDSYHLSLFHYLLEGEVDFVFRANHVIHLAEEIHKQNWIVLQGLKPSHLFLVEVFHLIRGDDPIAINIHYVKPVSQRSGRGLILFAQHEPNKVFVTHLPFSIRLELSGHLIEDPIARFPAERIPLVSTEVFLIDEEIVVRIQFPKPTV